MRFFKKAICLLAVCALPMTAQAYTVRGRADIGFVGVTMSHLAHGKTTNRTYLYGTRADATIVPFEGYGIAIKPTAIYATGNGDFVQGGIQLAHYTPLTDCFTLVPGIGYSYGDLRSKIKLDIPNVGVFKPNQKIVSNTLFCACDLYYKLNEQWLLTGIFQYGWARAHSKIHTEDFLGFRINEEGSSEGPSIAGMVDYYITECLTVNAAVGYSRTLTKERHGVKIFGYKAGLGYLF